LAPLCQQMGWQVPTPTRWETFTAKPRKLPATEVAFNKVELYLKECLERGIELPATQQAACDGSKANERAFRRACAVKRTNFISLRHQVSKTYT